MPRRLSLRRFYQLFSWLIIVFLFFTLVLVFYFLNLIFKVKNIQIEGVDRKTTLIGLENILQHNLILLNKSKTERQIKQVNPQVKEAKVTKIFPDTIKINIALYKPEIILVGQNVYFYLSEDGRILFKSKNKDLSLPVIYYYQKLNPYIFQPGDWLNYSDIKTAIKLEKIFSDLGIKIERVDIGGDDMIVFKEGKRSFIFSLKKDVKIIENELIKIIRQFKIEGKDFTSLDLRFDKAIVKF